MPKIKITQDQMLAVYLERILKDKGEWAEDAQEQKRQIERLRQKLDDRVEREMMRALSDDQLDELERRLDDGMDDDELEEFLGNTGADFGAAVDQIQPKKGGKPAYGRTQRGPGQHPGRRNHRQRHKHLPEPLALPGVCSGISQL